MSGLRQKLLEAGVQEGYAPHDHDGLMAQWRAFAKAGKLKKFGLGGEAEGGADEGVGGNNDDNDTTADAGYGGSFSDPGGWSTDSLGGMGYSDGSAYGGYGDTGGSSLGGMGFDNMGAYTPDGSFSSVAYDSPSSWSTGALTGLGFDDGSAYGGYNPSNAEMALGTGDQISALDSTAGPGNFGAYTANGALTSPVSVDAAINDSPYGSEQETLSDYGPNGRVDPTLGGLALAGSLTPDPLSDYPDPNLSVTPDLGLLTAHNPAVEEATIAALTENMRNYDRTKNPATIGGPAQVMQARLDTPAYAAAYGPTLHDQIHAPSQWSGMNVAGRQTARTEAIQAAARDYMNAHPETYGIVHDAITGQANYTNGATRLDGPDRFDRVTGDYTDTGGQRAWGASPQAQAALADRQATWSDFGGDIANQYAAATGEQPTAVGLTGAPAPTGGPAPSNPDYSDISAGIYGPDYSDISAGLYGNLPAAPDYSDISAGLYGQPASPLDSTYANPDKAYDGYTSGPGTYGVGDGINHGPVTGPVGSVLTGYASENNLPTGLGDWSAAAPGVATALAAAAQPTANARLDQGDVSDEGKASGSHKAATSAVQAAPVAQYTENPPMPPARPPEDYSVTQGVVTQPSNPMHSYAGKVADAAVGLVPGIGTVNTLAGLGGMLGIGPGSLGSYLSANTRPGIDMGLGQPNAGHSDYSPTSIAKADVQKAQEQASGTPTQAATTPALSAFAFNQNRLPRDLTHYGEDPAGEYRFWASRGGLAGHAAMLRKRVR
jgi:hypothetical protein